jgi:hypothetical protein
MRITNKNHIKKITSSIVLILALVLFFIATPASAVDYNYDVIGSTGQVGITGIGIYPSINDYGNVAFVGRFATGQGIFVGNGTTAPKNIIPKYYLRDLGDSVQISNNNKIAGRDRLAGNPPKFRIQIWDYNLPDTYNIVAMGGGTFDSYDSVIGPVSMNNKEQTVFAALKGSTEWMTTSAFIGLNEAPVRFSIRPKIDDTGHIVVQTYDYIKLYDYSLGGAVESIASPSNGFTLLGKMPGISDDGSIIVFAGNRGNGPGIFASLKDGSSRTLFKIAGENGGPSLGNDSSGNPINFSSFEINSTVAVIHQILGSAGLANDSFVVTFMATPAAASPGNFTAQKGIWTVRIDAWTPAVGQYKINTPSQVMQINDMFLSGNASGLITDFNLYDPIANAATDNSGNTRTQLRGEHRLVFWAKTSSGEMVVRASNTSDKPDLKVNSSSISISQTKVNVTVYNIGNAKAMAVNVKIIRELKDLGIEIDNETRVISEIPGRSSEKISINWVLSDVDDIKVKVDPDNLINEPNETNNDAETHKIKGNVTEEINGNKPIKYAKVEYKEKSGTTWETKYLTFTDDEGKYIIPLNHENITKEKEVRVNVSLEFSPNGNPANIKARFYNDSEWGVNFAKNFLAKSISKSNSISNSLDKEKDYFNRDVKFKPTEGGSTYEAFINAYLYYKKPTVRFLLPNLVDVEVGDIDYVGLTSYFDPASKTLHMWHGHLIQNMMLKDIVAHEYSHMVSSPWGIPYGPGGPGDGAPKDGMDENWANFGATLANKDWNSTKDFTPKFVNFEKDHENFAPGDWMWSMADVWWDLNHSDIRTPNIVVETFNKSHPQTVKAFYQNYSILDTNRTPLQIKTIFRNHGYLTAGWPPAGPPDPDFFTNNFDDHKIDTDGDGTAEYLAIDTGLNITTSGNYSIYGFLKDSIKSEYCFAINNTFLDAGLQTAVLEFEGECIFQNKLNGTYNLTGIYLADETKTEIDYRIDIYDTVAYRYDEFKMPVAAFTGSYIDHGIDMDGDGLYDHLAIDANANVSKPGKYLISGSLFDSSGNYIDFSSTLFNLSNGSNNIEIRFAGVSIYANKDNGPLTVRGLTIVEDKSTIFYDPDTFITKIYNYSQFQIPGGAFVGTPVEQVVDKDNDSLFDSLIISTDLNITSNGIYSVIGSLADSDGRVITIASNYSEFSINTQTLSLIYDGEILRRNKANGPYTVTLTLYSNDSSIDNRTYISSPYSYLQFQANQEDYFETYFSDHGTDLDGNGKYDYLTIDANISTSVRSGNYTFEGYLVSENHVIVGYSNISSYINENPKAISFNFSGQNIWKNHYPDGIFKLILKISDENKTKIGYLDDAYLTSSYSYIKFEVPQISTISDLTNTTYSTTYINWKWMDPTIADFASVNVWIDGVFKTNVPKGEQFYNASGFLPETEHTITLRTVNLTGVIASIEAKHTASTGPILLPPVILNLDPAPGSTFPINTPRIQLSLQTDKPAECRFSETSRDFNDMSGFDSTIFMFYSTYITNITNGKNYTVFINCKDQAGVENNTESFTFYVHNRTFLPPVLETVPSINALENETLSILINVTDPENDPLTIMISDRAVFGYTPIASRFTMENKTFKLNTNFNDAGKYYLRVSASDGKDTVTRDFTLNVINVNRPPVLTHIGNQIAIEGSFFSYNVMASDPDGDELLFSDNTTLFNINPFNGKISFTPRNSQTGDHYVNISVTDGQYTDSEVVLFHITNVNNPPVIEPILPQRANVGALFTLQINASDPDHDNLSFSDDTPLFNISAGGLINFIPAADEGIYLINITATDGQLNSTRILNLIVESANNPPKITNITDRITVYRNETFHINVTACDPDIDAGCN